MSELEHDTIRRRAASLWEREGRPDGRDEEIWLFAEQELRLERAEHQEAIGDPLNDPESEHRGRGLATGAEHGAA